MTKLPQIAVIACGGFLKTKLPYGNNDKRIFKS